MTAFAICFMCLRENRAEVPAPENWTCQHCGASLAACGQRLDRPALARSGEGGGRALAGRPVPGYLEGQC